MNILADLCHPEQCSVNPSRRVAYVGWRSNASIYIVMGTHSGSNGVHVQLHVQLVL